MIGPQDVEGRRATRGSATASSSSAQGRQNTSKRASARAKELVEPVVQVPVQPARRDASARSKRPTERARESYANPSGASQQIKPAAAAAKAKDKMPETPATLKKKPLPGGMGKVAPPCGSRHIVSEVSSSEQDESDKDSAQTGGSNEDKSRPGTKACSRVTGGRKRTQNKESSQKDLSLPSDNSSSDSSSSSSDHESHDHQRDGSVVAYTLQKKLTVDLLPPSFRQIAPATATPLPRKLRAAS